MGVARGLAGYTKFARGALSFFLRAFCGVRGVKTSVGGPRQRSRGGGGRVSKKGCCNELWVRRVEAFYDEHSFQGDEGRSPRGRKYRRTLREVRDDHFGDWKLRRRGDCRSSKRY